jgi:hypothetical protein
LDVNGYDPSVGPDGKQWLALDEGERIALVRDFHARNRIGVPNAEAHAVIHAIVENQLAEELPAAVAALQRLEAEGLDRHESVHAIGSVLTEHMRALMNGSRDSADPHGPYFVALEKLTADSWRRSGQ